MMSKIHYPKFGHMVFHIFQYEEFLLHHLRFVKTDDIFFVHTLLDLGLAINFSPGRHHAAVAVQAANANRRYFKPDRFASACQHRFPLQMSRPQ